MGRPSKYTPERAERILEGLRLGNSRKAAVACAGINYLTFLAWLDRYQTFCTAVEIAEGEAEARALKAIRDCFEDGTWTAAAWWLERRRHQDYGRIDRVEVTLRERAAKIAAATGADPDWLVARAEEIAREAQTTKT